MGAVTGILGVGGALGTLASGISVGGGRNNTTSVTETEDRIIVIPPHSKISMPPKVYINSKKDKTTKNYEIIETDAVRFHEKIEKWRYISLGENYINNATNFLITYSTTQDFSTYSSLSFGMFPIGLLGVGGVDATTNYNNFISVGGPCMIGDYIWINRKQ